MTIDKDSKLRIQISMLDPCRFLETVPSSRVSIGVNHWEKNHIALKMLPKLFFYHFG